MKETMFKPFEDLVLFIEFFLTEAFEILHSLVAEKEPIWTGHHFFTIFSALKCLSRRISVIVELKLYNMFIILFVARIM